MQIGGVEMHSRQKLLRYSWRSTRKGLWVCRFVNKIAAHTFYSHKYYFWAKNCIFTEIAPHTFYQLYGIVSCMCNECLPLLHQKCTQLYISNTTECILCLSLSPCLQLLLDYIAHMTWMYTCVGTSKGDLFTDYFEIMNTFNDYMWQKRNYAAIFVFVTNKNKC